MKRCVIAAGLAASLSGCFGPGEPIVLSDNDFEAAETCFAAASYVERAQAQEGDDVTFSQFVNAIQYPLAAAGRAEPFDAAAAETILEGVDAELERIAALDHAGGVEQCNARFAIPEVAPVLPEDDQTAIMACAGIGGYIGGALTEPGIENVGEAADTMAFAEGLAERLDTDPAIIMMSQEDFDEKFNAALAGAFAAGKPGEYVTQCKARFPAE